MSGERLNVAPHAGIVVRLAGGMATVRFARGEMCEHCGACISVGDKELEMTVPNALNAAIGDHVQVSLAPKRIVQASLIAYAVPLALLLVGVWAGSLYSDFAALIGGMIGCGAGYLILRRIEKHGGARTKFQPQMTRLLYQEEPGEAQEQQEQL